jgi:hypothetical protein
VLLFLDGVIARLDAAPLPPSEPCRPVSCSPPSAPPVARIPGGDPLLIKLRIAALLTRLRIAREGLEENLRERRPGLVLHRKEAGAAILLGEVIGDPNSQILWLNIYQLGIKAPPPPPLPADPCAMIAWLQEMERALLDATRTPPQARIDVQYTAPSVPESNGFNINVRTKIGPERDALELMPAALEDEDWSILMVLSYHLCCYLDARRIVVEMGTLHRRDKRICVLGQNNVARRLRALARNGLVRRPPNRTQKGGYCITPEGQKSLAAREQVVSKS